MAAVKGVYQVGADVEATYRKFKLGRKYRWVTFQLNNNDDGSKMYDVDYCEEDRSKDVNDLCKELPEHDCRFVVFDYEYKTTDGRPADKLFFINWNPRSAATTTQMDYLTGRPAIRNICDGCFDVSATTSGEIKTGIIGDDGGDSDPDEVDGDDSWLD